MRNKEKEFQAFSFESRHILTQDKAYRNAKRASREEIRHNVKRDAKDGGGGANQAHF